MKRHFLKKVFFPSALFACFAIGLTTGCASGGFKLTRQYASFVNRQDIIIRVVLYLLTGIIFAVTLWVDFVIFNTVDFWEGRVSQGTYDFKKDGKIYVAHHEFMGGGTLRRSTLQAFGSDGKQIQKVVLQETTDGQIEMFVDGKIRARVHNLSSLPVASIFNGSGQPQSEIALDFKNQASHSAGW